MSTELVYRMRTCAAAILEVDPKSGWVALVTDDAANLLIEAANLLDAPEPLGEPMAIISNAQAAATNAPMVQWGGDLPAVQARPCPACGDISARTVKRSGRKLMLQCPKCPMAWEYGK